jgi:hypothetical protein
MTLLKIPSVACGLALGLAVLATGGRSAVHGGQSRTVQQELLRQVNSGPAGHITRAVHCSQASNRSSTFSCTLVSTRSTTLRARVVLDGTQLRTAWAPLQG